MTPLESLERALRSLGKNEDFVPKPFSSTTLWSLLLDATAKMELRILSSHSRLFS